jgi:hypothetical protein
MVQKLSIEALLGMLMDLYESGMDFVDLTSDNSDPEHDKLIIMTRDEYLNPDTKYKMEENGDKIEDLFPEHKKEFEAERNDDEQAPEEDEQRVFPPNKHTIKGKPLTDEDLDNLID